MVIAINRGEVRRVEDVPGAKPIEPRLVVDSIVSNGRRLSSLTLLHSLWANISRDNWSINKILFGGRDGKLVDFNQVLCDETSWRSEKLCAVAALMMTANPTVQRLSKGRFDPELRGKITTTITRPVKINEGDLTVADLEWNGEKVAFYRYITEFLNEGFSQSPEFAFAVCSTKKRKGDPEVGHGLGFEVFPTFFPKFSQLLNLKFRLGGNVSTSQERALVSKIERIPDLRETLEALNVRHRKHVYGKYKRVEAIIEEYDISVGRLIEQLIQYRLDASPNGYAEGTWTLSLASLVNQVVQLAEATGYRKILNDTELSIELAFLSQKDDKTTQALIALEQQGNETIDFRILSGGQEAVQARLSFDPEISGVFRQYRFLGEKFGLAIDPKETLMMREITGNKDAYVIPIEAIRRNPKGYWELQRDLVIKIATDLEQEKAINLNILRDARNKSEIFKLLLKQSDWLWLLTIPEVQKRLIDVLPYTGVPPYVVLNNRAVPLWNEQQQSKIFQAIEEGRVQIVNQLPVFNYIGVADETTEKRRYEVWPTIPAEVVRRGREDGAIIYVDHATARQFLGGWNPKGIPLSSRYYAVYSPEERRLYAPMDVDMLKFGGKKSGGKLTNEVASDFNLGYQAGLHASTVLGRSMSGIDWAYIAKDTDPKIKKNPGIASHDPSCLVHILEAWDPTNIRRHTDNLITNLTGLSRMRSIGFIPEVFLDKNNTVTAWKYIDVLGGQIDYSEAGGGVTVNKRKYNVIRFPINQRAFPDNEPLAAWHGIRTVEDLFYSTDPAIILPEGLLVDYSHLDVPSAVREGYIQLRGNLQRVASHLQKIIEQLNPGEKSVKIPDLKRELKSFAREAANHDLYAFLTLFSGDEIEDQSLRLVDPERMMYGLELSLFYPHLHELRRHKDIWKEILLSVKTGQRQSDETNLEFLAREILGVEGTEVIIRDALREEFIHNPVEIGRKLCAWNRYKARVVQPGPIRHEDRDWLILDIDGVGKFATRYAFYEFDKFLRRISMGENVFDEAAINHWDDAEQIIIDHFRRRELETAVVAARSIRNKLDQRSGHQFDTVRNRQVHALADWLISQNF